MDPIAFPRALSKFAFTFDFEHKLSGSLSGLDDVFPQRDISYFDKTLSTLPRLKEGMGIVYAPSMARSTMQSLIGYLSLQSDVIVIDGGNQLDLHYIAYAVRRKTYLWEQAVKRIRIVRAFTSYEVLKAIEQLSSTPTPKLILNMFDTFYDDSIKDAEAFSLAQKCLILLRGLSTYSPVLVNLGPIPTNGSERAGLNQIALNLSDRNLISIPQANSIYQLALF